MEPFTIILILYFIQAIVLSIILETIYFLQSDGKKVIGDDGPGAGMMIGFCWPIILLIAMLASPIWIGWLIASIKRLKEDVKH
jgi:hypothetical protein